MRTGPGRHDARPAQRAAARPCFARTKPSHGGPWRRSGGAGLQPCAAKAQRGYPSAPRGERYRGCGQAKAGSSQKSGPHAHATRRRRLAQAASRCDLKPGPGFLIWRASHEARNQRQIADRDVPDPGAVRQAKRRSGCFELKPSRVDLAGRVAVRVGFMEHTSKHISN